MIFINNAHVRCLIGAEMTKTLQSALAGFGWADIAWSLGVDQLTIHTPKGRHEFRMDEQSGWADLTVLDVLIQHYYRLTDASRAAQTSVNTLILIRLVERGEVTMEAARAYQADADLLSDLAGTLRFTAPGQDDVLDLLFGPAVKVETKFEDEDDMVRPAQLAFRDGLSKFESLLNRRMDDINDLIRAERRRVDEMTTAYIPSDTSGGW